MGICGCSGEIYFFYGLDVPSNAFIMPIEAFSVLRIQLIVLDILAARRCWESEVDQESGSRSAASKIPEDIWTEIRSTLISQELDILEKNAELGIGKSCGAGKRVKMKPSDKWSCDQARKDSGRGICWQCQEYLTFGFRQREDPEKILDSLLATYDLFRANVSGYSRLNRPQYIGIATHPPLNIGNQIQISTDMHHRFDSRSMPTLSLLPVIDEASSRIRMSRFLRDFRIEIEGEPCFEGQAKDLDREDVEIEDNDQDKDEDDSQDEYEVERRSAASAKRKLLEELKKRASRHPPNVPQWRTVLQVDLEE